MHIEQISRYIIDLMATLLHYTMLQFILMPQFVLPLHLDVRRLSFGCWIILFMSESTPCGLTIFSLCFSRCFAVSMTILSHFTFYLWVNNVSIVRTHWLQKLFPSISLNTKLLFGSPDFTSSIGVKITLLKLLDKFLNIRYNFVNNGLICPKVGSKSSWWFDADGTV